MFDDLKPQATYAPNTLTITDAFTRAELIALRIRDMTVTNAGKRAAAMIAAEIAELRDAWAKVAPEPSEARDAVIEALNPQDLYDDALKLGHSEEVALRAALGGVFLRAQRRADPEAKPWRDRLDKLVGHKPLDFDETPREPHSRCSCEALLPNPSATPRNPITRETL